MDVSQVCNLCKKPCDQMLMLACVHDPCINCAATAYAQQVHIKGQNPDIYICELCPQQTVLDSTTIDELSSLAKSYVRVPTSAKTIVTAAKHKGVGSSNSPNTKRKDPPSQKVVYYCKEHSEQELTYYCFVCQRNVCPECPIHGGCKGHQVKLIRKAISDVKGEYIEVVSKIGTCQNQVTKYKDNFLRCIRETNQRHSRLKNLVCREFQNLRHSTVLKEKEIIKNLENVNKENIQILTSFLEDINSHYQQHAKVKKIIQGILRKDQVLILQDYKKIGQLNERIATVKKQSDQISGQITYLNTEFLQQQLKQLTDTLINLKQNIKKQPITSSPYSKGNQSINQSIQPT